jgi:GTP pyrophosphokinase
MLVLIDYGLIDSVLLKAALVHDHLEDLDNFDVQLIIDCDHDGEEVYKLVLEVSRQPGENKIEFLKRVYEKGSFKACALKAADRITNLCDCQFLMEKDFISRLCDESELYILPIAERVCKEMTIEIRDLIGSARKLLTAL